MASIAPIGDNFFNIDTFKSNFDGGARAYLFLYIPSFPQDVRITEPGNSYKDSYYIRATNLPESVIDENIVSYRGFDYKIHGKRTYNDWTVTFNSDRDYVLRSCFEIWMDLLASNGKYGKIGDYLTTQTLKLLDNKGGILKNSKKTRMVKLYEAWPKNISNVTLDYSTQDVAQFDVTFAYQWHKIER